MTAVGRFVGVFRHMPGLERTAVLAALAAAVLLGMAGCRSTGQRIELASSFTAPKRDLDYTRGVLDSNARRWTNLAATCEIVITNPQIPGPEHQVTINDGSLVFSKPGSIRITAPDSDQPSVKMVGDGKTYRVDMPVFSSTYSGKYSDPVTPQQGRISFLPPEVATALEPTILLAERAPMLIQLESHSGLYSLAFVTAPEPAVKPTGLIVLDRRRERPASVEEYKLEDGSLRARIVYLDFEMLPVAGGEAAVVPTLFRIVYPEEQTAVQVLLHDVTLNGKINPAQFKVPG
jgi:hypothetical protein